MKALITIFRQSLLLLQFWTEYSE